MADTDHMIVPDTKDWTWVLDQACPDCGLDTTTTDAPEVAGRLRANATAWHAMLTGPGDLAARPDPAVWSALEYGCHVRDACRIFATRLDLMLTEDDPLFPNWDQDSTAIAERYGDQDPARVADELADAAETLALGFEHVSGQQWQRTGRRSDGAHFTVASFARYFLHDPVHHLYDVTGRRAA
jgi:hypothetical protein